MQSQTIERAAVKPAKASRDVGASAAPKSIAELIEAHRLAHAEHVAACDDLEIAELAYQAANNKEPYLIPDLMGGHYDVRALSFLECERRIRQRCTEARQSARAAAKVTTGNLEQIPADIDAKEAESVAAFKAAWINRERSVRKTSGLDDADKRSKKACHASVAAAKALCAAPCNTLDEARAKAAHLIAHEDIFDCDGNYLRLLLRSFLATQS